MSGVEIHHLRERQEREMKEEIEHLKVIKEHMALKAEIVKLEIDSETEIKRKLSTLEKENEKRRAKMKEDQGDHKEKYYKNLAKKWDNLKEFDKWCKEEERKILKGRKPEELSEAEQEDYRDFWNIMKRERAEFIAGTKKF
jgi:hypothetical protein